MNPTEARQKLVFHMARLCDMTPKMCEDKTSDQLLFLAHVTVQHRRSLGLGFDADEIIRLGELEKLAAELRRVQ